jgi:hypothetical protein
VPFPGGGRRSVLKHSECWRGGFLVNWQCHWVSGKMKDRTLGLGPGLGTTNTVAATTTTNTAATRD